MGRQLSLFDPPVRKPRPPTLRDKLAVHVQLVRESFQMRGPRIESNEDVYELMPELREIDREQFCVIALDGKSNVLGKEMISQGTLTASMVHPREVFKGLILANAKTFIACHNHPSGDPRPSREDIEITKRLEKAGELLGIELLDHVIIGHGSFRSLADSGLLGRG